MDTAERIISHLRTHPHTSAAELSRLLNITVQDVRHHLHNLEKKGILEKFLTGPSGKRGRPVHFYRLGAPEQSVATDPLFKSFLEVFIQFVPGNERPAWIAELAANIAGENYRTIRNPSQRLNRSMIRLAQLGYVSRWEARPEGPRIYIEHSPFTALYRKYPDLESLDWRILECLTGYLFAAHDTYSVGSQKPPSQAVPAPQIKIYSVKLG